MRHRRIPKSRKQKGLKPVDPFNFKQKELIESTKVSGLAPVNDNHLECLPGPNRKLHRIMKNVPKPSKKRPKVKTDELIVEDYSQRRWETDRKFMSRVFLDTQAFIEQETLKIKSVGDRFEGSKKRPERRKTNEINRNDDGNQIASTSQINSKNDGGPQRKRRKKSKAQNHNDIKRAIVGKMKDPYEIERQRLVALYRMQKARKSIADKPGIEQVADYLIGIK